MRILHAPTAVSGHGYALSRAERELGLDSDVAIIGPPSVYGFKADVKIDSSVPLPRELARRVSFLRSALRKYDVFHFNFGRTIAGVQIGRWAVNELPLLKRRGKKVLVTFQGCDVRPPSECYCAKQECADMAEWREVNAASMLRHADRVFYVMPDLRRWLPGASFIPFATVDPREIEPAPPALRDEVVVVHAPTDRNIKGTAHVIAAVEALQSEGLPIRLDLIEGVPRDEVMGRYAQADVMVDQLRMDWHGGSAVEAMALAKPVLSHIKEEEPDDNPFGDELPVLRTSVDTIRDDLRTIALDPARRREVGLAGRRFVEEHHDPRQIARTILEGVVPLPREPAPVAA